MHSGRTVFGMKTSAWVCLLGAVGFWATVAAEGLHMQTLWVVVSTVLLAVAGLGLVGSFMPNPASPEN